MFGKSYVFKQVDVRCCLVGRVCVAETRVQKYILQMGPNIYTKVFEQKLKMQSSPQPIPTTGPCWDQLTGGGARGHPRPGEEQALGGG